MGIVADWIFDDDETDRPRRAETKRLGRALSIAALLTREPNCWKRAGLALEYGVCQRTIDRDLDLLRGAGYEIAHDKETGYAFEHVPPLPPVMLSLPDVLPLAIAATVLAGLLMGRHGPVLSRA